MLEIATNRDSVPAEMARLIVSPRAYARQHQLFAAFRYLRRNNPIGRIELGDFEPFRIVTRHADIIAISRQSDIFRNGERPAALVPRATDQRVRALTGGNPHLIRTLVHMDAPDHPEYRRVTQAWFAQQGISALLDGIRKLARHAVDRMLELDGECEFVADVARPFPLRVMAGILGLPDEDAPHVLALTERFFASQDELIGDRTSARDPARHAAHLVRVLRDFSDYFGPLLKARAKAPRDDLLTAIAQANIAGAPIPEFEAISYLLILATAGHHTTSSAIAGGVWALCERPDEFRKVFADRSLIPDLVEEAVRWTTPVQHFMRTAVRDVEVNGSHISAGDWLMLNYLSASRDESACEAPEEFRVDRRTAAASFGHGVHICLGQHLARAEMRIFFEEMLARIADIGLKDRPTRSASIFVGGPISVPLRYRVV
jgi:cytochrome P450